MTHAEVHPELRQRISSLCESAGLARATSVDVLTDGANNQVYRVDTQPRTVAAKVYYQHGGDPRDRLGSEWSFVSLAWNNGIRTVPEPIAVDREAGIAIYEYVHGQKLSANEISRSAVQEAVGFCLDLQSLRNRREARELPRGAEACFTLAEHLDCVRSRIGRLQQNISPDSDVDAAARDFVAEELAPAAAALFEDAQTAAATWGIGHDAEIPADRRWISPSDFGFHNALRGPDDRLRFIDFEYAGWDDPAKLVCDFFCQPERPVSEELYGEFSRAISNATRCDQHARRVELLLPVYRLKWCCIMLNEFLPCGGRRRRFAVAEDAETRKWGQLNKAREALARLRKKPSQLSAA